MSTMTIVSGPVFCGKTNYFISLVDGFRAQGYNILTLKPYQSSLYAKHHVVSHDGQRTEGLAIEDPYEILNLLDEDPDINAIAIDEVHYFQWDFLEVVEEIQQRKVHLILSGLDLDFKGQPFGIVPHLFSYATSIKKMQGTCSVCGEPSMRSQRFVHDKPAKRQDPIVLSGEGIRYEPRCIHHFELLP